MRALVANPTASPPLSLADVPEPAPGPGELLLDMEAASVNRGEIRTAAKQPPGTVIGWDVAGTVAALGEGVTTFDVGERVVALSPNGGSFAERLVVPAEWTAPLPSACDFVPAATLPVAGVTGPAPSAWLGPTPATGSWSPGRPAASASSPSSSPSRPGPP